MNSIKIETKHIIHTIEELQIGGHKRCERVVLWLGLRNKAGIEIHEVFVPEQYAEQDFFRIPREAMAALLKHLRETRYFIAAQVHSHPELAFHSYVDDEWAIVRHEGALSLVLPYFGLRTTPNTFVQDAAVFELSSKNEWLKVSPRNIPSRYLITE